MSASPAQPPVTRSVALLEGSVVLLAVVLRIWAWVSIDSTWDATHPRVDALTYWQQALQVLADESPFAQGYYQPPGYPWLLSWQQALTETPDPRISRAFNLLFGVLSVLGIGRIGRLSSGWKYGGALAMGLFVLAAAPLRFELDLLTPATSILLLVASLNLLLPKPRPLESGIAGLLAGAGVLIHPTTLPAGLLIGAWLLYKHRASGAAWTLALLLPIAPLAVENRQEHSSKALISDNGGLNLYLFNSPNWKETAFLRPGLPFRALVLEAEPDKRGLPERNAYWKQRTMEELELGPWLLSVGEKAWWSIHNREIPRNEDWRCRTESGSLSWTRALPVRAGWLFPFAILGIVVLLRKREGTLPLAALGLWLPLLIFLPAERYRLPLFPLLCVLSSIGAKELIDGVRASKMDKRWGLLLLPLILSFWPIDHVTAKQPGWCAHRSGNLAFEQGNLEEAAEQYTLATQSEPNNPGHWYWLAQTHLRQKETAQAIAALERTAELFPAHYETRKQLQKEHGRLGQYSQAADHAGAGCALPGAAEIICARHIQLLVKAGRREEAREALKARPELAGHERVKGLGL